MKKILQVFCILLVTSTYLSSKDINVNDLPKILNMSNAGKEFYFTFIPGWGTDEPNDLKIYVSSNVKTLVHVEVEGKGYNYEKTTIPNDIVEFRLSPGTGQAYHKYGRQKPNMDTVYKKAAVHVYSDDPIICYAVTRFAYASDGFLCLPVNVLGKDYIVASYQDGSDNTTQWFPSYTGVTAVYDKTKVTFTMGGSEYSKTVAGLVAGETSTWNLDRGDVLLIGSSGKGSDLTGSTISATKPVSVVSGNFCAEIEGGPCDILEEMELPTNLWGNEYHVSPIVSRKKNSIIRIFSKEAKTKIFRDGNQVGYLRSVGGKQGDGWFEMRADTGLPRPVVIAGDKPISVTLYNTGYIDDSSSAGEPFQMVLIPIEQYSNEIVFNTPGIRGGMGFVYNYTNLIYEANENDSIPDDMEFAQVIAADFAWVKLKELSPYPGKKFERTTDLKNYFSKTILLPGDGVYRIRANNPFGAYIYGFSSYDSYGYPAASALKDISKFDTLPPEPEWEMSGDGTVNIHKTKYVTDKPDDSLNRSNLSTIFIHSDVSYNYKLYYSDFMPCETPVASWRLEILDYRDDARAVVTFRDCAGNDTTLDIFYKSTDVREEINSDGITFNPNPATDKMIITSDKPISDIKIFDILGCERYCPYELGEGRAVVNTADLNDDIYFVRLLIGKRIMTKKFIIRR